MAASAGEDFPTRHAEGLGSEDAQSWTGRKQGQPPRAKAHNPGSGSDNRSVFLEFRGRLRQAGESRGQDGEPAGPSPSFPPELCKSPHPISLLCGTRAACLTSVGFADGGHSKEVPSRGGQDVLLEGTPFLTQVPRQSTLNTLSLCEQTGVTLAPEMHHRGHL